MNTTWHRGRTVWGTVLAGGLLSLAWVGDAQPTNAPVYFLVSRLAWLPGFHDESYVLPLRDADQIAHARWLIGVDAINRYGNPTNPLEVGGVRIAARVEAAPDGINRNYSVSGFPAWSWHVTTCYGFPDMTLEEMNGSPSGVEASPEYWVKTGIGFWHYTVARELGPVPLFLDAQRRDDELRFYWSGVGTNVVYSLEAAEVPGGTNWIALVTGLKPAQTNQWSLPLPASEARFYRVRADPAPP